MSKFYSYFWILSFHQIREMEQELEEERKLRQSAQAAKRKLEGQVSDYRNQLENANKIKEEGSFLHLSQKLYLQPSDVQKNEA